jgi:hypothetical protein
LGQSSLEVIVTVELWAFAGVIFQPILPWIGAKARLEMSLSQFQIGKDHIQAASLKSGGAFQYL